MIRTRPTRSAARPEPNVYSSGLAPRAGGADALREAFESGRKLEQCNDFSLKTDARLASVFVTCQLGCSESCLRLQRPLLVPPTSRPQNPGVLALPRSAGRATSRATNSKPLQLQYPSRPKNPEVAFTEPLSSHSKQVTQVLLLRQARMLEENSAAVMQIPQNGSCTLLTDALGACSESVQHSGLQMEKTRL